MCEKFAALLTSSLRCVSQPFRMRRSRIKYGGSLKRFEFAVRRDRNGLLQNPFNIGFA
jgi:hypothetical protein